MSKVTGPLSVAQKWLEAHSGSSHTRRKYDAQLQQFCEWLLLGERNLTSAHAKDVEQYLSDLTRGMVSFSTRHRGTERSRRTVMLARSVLCTFFEALIREGLRPDNPARLAALPEVTGINRYAQEMAAGLHMQWLDIRDNVLEDARHDEAPRSPLRRAVAIAELASWAGLRRSELAVATMADFRKASRRWWIKVRRFARGEEDLVEIPQPAIDAISMYRLCRDLPELPEAGEENVPLIARLATEAPVSSWTIAHALKDLLPTNGQANEHRPNPPTIVALRREVASEALKSRIAAHQLARHMRSTTLVDQVTLAMERAPIGRALQRLAA